MIKIYGTMLCKDCIEICKLYDEKKIAYTFYNFQDRIENLKEFIQMRDRSPVFDMAKTEGIIGIPCLVLEDGTITLDPEDGL